MVRMDPKEQGLSMEGDRRTCSIKGGDRTHVALRGLSPPYKSLERGTALAHHLATHTPHCDCLPRQLTPLVQDA